ADGTDEGVEARDWCASHLDPDDKVLAVAGLDEMGQFVLGIPPFDVLKGEKELRAHLEDVYCTVMVDKGFACEARLLPHGQAGAVLAVARAEHADMIVVGKHTHRWLGDALRGEVASRLLHEPPCAVLVVPVSHPAEAVRPRSPTS